MNKRQRKKFIKKGKVKTLNSDSLFIRVVMKQAARALAEQIDRDLFDLIKGLKHASL